MRPSQSALLWSLLLAAPGQLGLAAAEPLRAPDVAPPGASSQISMPEKLVEVPGKLEGKIVVLEMDQFPRERWIAVERRLQQELQVLGLETERVSSRARDRPARVAELRQQAAERRAVGALRILRRGERRRVEIWLHDALTGKTVHRQLDVDEAPSEPNAVSLVALRAVEVLHSSLIEVRMNERLRGRAPAAVERFISRVEAAQNAEKDEAEEGPEGEAALHRWRAWMGPAVGVDLGDARVGALPLAQIGVGLRLLPWLSCELEADLPLLAATIQDHRGAADVLVTRVVGLLSLEPWARWRWSPSLALGVGLLALNASGTSTEARIAGLSQWATVTWLSLRCALSVRIASRLRLVGALSLGAAVPGVLVLFEEDVVATVGQPWLGGQLGLEWRWSSI